MSDETELTALHNILDDFESFLKGEAGKKPSLRENWIYMQVFATYGLRLPHTTKLLQGYFDLDPAEAGKRPWFTSMVNAYGELNKSSEFFFSDVFNKMTDLGSGLSSFATDVVGEDSMFTLIGTLIRPGEDQDLDAVQDFLEDLKESAAENHDLADQVKENLLKYQKKLAGSQKKVKKAQDDVDQDKDVSQKTIDKYEGGADASDSLKNLQKQLHGKLDDFQDDIDAIKLSAAYAWATGVGAAVAIGEDIYHIIDAEKVLDDIDTLNAQIEVAQTELKRALNVQAVDNSATASLDRVSEHLRIAIEKTKAVQQGWKGIAAGLDYLSDKVTSTLKPDGLEDQKLVAIRSIKHYMDQAQNRWRTLQPLIESMTSNVVISVEAKPLDLDELKARILALKGLSG